MSEPMDMQKMLAAYGAELDELRVWYRKQEERLAALEAQAAPAPEYAPGWVKDKPPYFDCGLGAIDFTPLCVEFTYTQSDKYVTLCVQSDDGDDYAEVELDVSQMKELIGAALEILKRMNSEGE